MRTRVAALLGAAGLTLAALARAQTPPSFYDRPAPTAAPGPATTAARLDVYAYPSQGQTDDQQSRDETECYAWAARATGYDAFAILEQAEQHAAIAQQRAAASQRNAEAARAQASQVGAGAGAQGAVAGAATGALIGSWGANAGEGAAIGAVVGLIAGRARADNAQSQAEARVDAQVDAQMQRQAQETQRAQRAFDARLDGFRKAFAVCMEAKHYLVEL
jgi:outer membrane protein with glycine zipper